VYIGSLFTCREYFEFLETKRQEIVSSLKRRYDLIGPLLIKIESLVFGTSTGKHRNSKSINLSLSFISIFFLVHSFYIYWEHEIFISLVELVIRNLCQFFENIFFGNISFFTVDILLAPPRIKLQPSLEEIINSIRRSAHGISELPKYFIRWLHGTCISCPSAIIRDEDYQSPPDLTFNNDVKQHPDVVS
jgi:dynein heavy chain